MNSSDSAEELIKIYLDGVSFALKIAGEGSKNLIAFFIAISKDNNQTKGKTRLTNMLKTGKELKIFTIKAENLKKFSQEAKKYGVLYCVLADKKNEKIDGMVDIMVRQEDAAKVNRIAERFNFTKLDTATIEKEKQNNEKVIETKSKDEQIIDELLAEPKELKEEIEKSNNNSPSNEQSEKKSQLESSLNTKTKLEKDELYYNGKNSVKKELNQIQKKLDEKREKNGKHFKQPKYLDTQNDNKKRRKRNKIRERSK